MKADVRIEEWSARRDLGVAQGGVVQLRVSPVELQQIEDTAHDKRVRVSDVMRASLIYAGVIDAPAPCVEFPVVPVVNQ